MTRIYINTQSSIEILNMGHSMSSGPISEIIFISTSLILMKVYRLLEIFFKHGSVKFQLQIINGWCTSITNVEVTFVAVGWVVPV